MWGSCKVAAMVDSRCASFIVGMPVLDQISKWCNVPIPFPPTVQAVETFQESISECLPLEVHSVIDRGTLMEIS